MKTGILAKARWLFIGMAVILCVSCAGESGHGDSTASVSFRLKFPGSQENQIATARVDCSASGVSTVIAMVFGPDRYLNVIGGPWSCDSHYGEVSGVPTGSGIKVAVIARDGNGSQLYYAVKDGITISAGSTTDIGELSLTKTTDEMAFIPGGCYNMGDNFNEGTSGEKPVHKVCLNDFFMDRYEVTQNAYQSVTGNNPSAFSSCGGDCPVENVSWDDSNSYCSQVGKRLPTEAEWEYAAREAGRVVRYGTGKDDISCSDANYSGCAGYTTVRVGSYAPNALGLYDMAGNVWEWVNDWYGDSYYGSSPVDNPQGPSSGPEHVLRGDSWRLLGGYPRVSKRDYGPAGNGDSGGFRCAYR